MNSIEIRDAMTLATDQSLSMGNREKLAAIIALEDWFGCGIDQIIDILK